MAILIEGYDKEKGHYVIDEETGETYTQEEIPDLVHQLLTNSFGHEPEYPTEERRKLAEEMNKAFRSKDFDKTPLGRLMGIDNKGK